ncbi:helix-turn-helix domain-containing protein [Natrialba sp. SSL1]|uniref:helix-turn-helix domain-containing protein n=1 Tax=Natrialba sp. SSL1 TaxID=1869245 RepID=UPI0008F8F8A4|nr:helix-turn-helix domain-containing protein [Natrialba sp. SSL1]OIB58941.1 hypothetical protein BBD46_06240 [Natrialba sp. SSL1]
MSKTERSTSGRFPEVRLQLKIWHPDCWTLQVTDQVSAGLVADGVYEVDSKVKTHLIAYGDRIEEIDELVEVVRDSPLTESVAVMEKNYDFETRTSPPGNATRELLVTYEPNNSIHDDFVSKGFIPDEPIRVKDGYEYWTVVHDGRRMDVDSQLDEIREEKNAEIEIWRMEKPDILRGSGTQFDELSERQREIFQLARRKGYYTWPREVSVTELAQEIDLSQATVLEHLRKAEAKLLGKSW